eukprot:tig00000133_g7710.t1
MAVKRLVLPDDEDDEAALEHVMGPTGDRSEGEEDADGEEVRLANSFGARLFSFCWELEAPGPSASASSAAVAVVSQGARALASLLAGAAGRGSPTPPDKLVARIWAEHIERTLQLKTGLLAAVGRSAAVLWRYGGLWSVLLFLVMCMVNGSTIIFSLAVDQISEQASFEKVIAMLAAGSAMTVCGRAVQNFIDARIVSNVLFALRRDLMNHMNRAPEQFYATHDESTLINMFTSDQVIVFNVIR